ncbi:glycosyltransferase family 2 protein [Rhizobium beringeri]
MPRVSICIPAYKPDFFEQALKSAIGQSYGDTEIIVSDDCPTDAIANICERYQQHLSYSRNPKPSEFSNVIRLANLADGEYIKFLFDDDILNPFCVQFLFETLEESRHLGTRLAFSPRYLIDGENRITSLVNHFGIADETKGHRRRRLHPCDGCQSHEPDWRVLKRDVPKGRLLRRERRISPISGR